MAKIYGGTTTTPINPDMFSGTGGVDVSYVNNNFANALKKNKTGKVVSLNDVSPIQHELKVEVSSKNLIDISQMVNDVFINNSDGTYTLTKSGSSRYAKRWYFNKPIPAGTKLYVSASIISNNQTRKDGVALALYTDEGNAINSAVYGIAKDTISEIILEKDVDYALIYIESSDIDGTSVTFKDFQIGLYPTKYEPYVALENVSVIRVGENLFDINKLESTSATIVRENEEFTITGYTAYFITSNLDVNKAYTIYFNSNRTGDGGGGLSIEFYDETNSIISNKSIYKISEKPQPIAFTVPDNTAAAKIYFYGSGAPGGKDSATYSSVVLGLDSDKQTVTANADGTVNGLKSLYPATTLLTDSNDVIIDCEYNAKNVIDQAYNPESENAQSGKAVAQAIGQYEFIMKYVVGYSVLEGEPEDWEINYTSYYENKGTLKDPIYVQLASLKPWEKGRFYSYSDGDTTLNPITYEPDGTPFCFKGIILDCSFTPASSNRNIVYDVRLNTNSANSGVLYSGSVTNGIKTTASWYQCCLEAMNSGIWTGVENANYTAKPLISRHIPRYEPMRSLRFNNTLFPAGSTITIYGVRA